MAKYFNARLYVAEDIRQEVDGKQSLIGLFSDGVLIVKVPEGQEIVLRSVAFMITLTEFPQDVETFELHAELVGPEGQAAVVAPPQEIRNPGVGRSANMIMVFSPLAFTGPGKRAVRVRIDGHTVDLPYEVRVERIPPLPGDFPAPRSSPPAAVKEEAAKRSGPKPRSRKASTPQK